jgi:hypothetical protein
MECIFNQNCLLPFFRLKYLQNWQVTFLIYVCLFLFESFPAGLVLCGLVSQVLHFVLVPISWNSISAEKFSYKFCIFVVKNVVKNVLNSNVHKDIIFPWQTSMPFGFYARNGTTFLTEVLNLMAQRSSYIQYLYIKMLHFTSFVNYGRNWFIESTTAPVLPVLHRHVASVHGGRR